MLYIMLQIKNDQQPPYLKKTFPSQTTLKLTILLYLYYLKLRKLYVTTPKKAPAYNMVTGTILKEIPHKSIIILLIIFNVILHFK